MKPLPLRGGPKLAYGSEVSGSFFGAQRKGRNGALIFSTYCGMWSSRCPVSLHRIFAVCFDHSPCGKREKEKKKSASERKKERKREREEEKGLEKAMETLSDCQDCIHFF